MRFLRENGIALVFGLACLLTIGAESGVAHHLYNQEQASHHEATISYFRYLVSSDFGSRIMENWQSEFLQFATFILGTVWLLQRGSPESKPLDQSGGESDQKQKVGGHADDDSPLWARVHGARRTLYENSLVLLMFLIFFATWFAQSVTSWTVFNSDQQAHHEKGLNYLHYLGTSDFWDRSLQNWQSEFLAVAAMTVFAVYLRQRGSPESKPVGASHDTTGDTG